MVGLIDTYPTLAQVEGPRAASGDRPAAGPVYRHKLFSAGPPSLGVGTCLELFETSASAFASHPCLGWRPAGPKGAGPYQFLTYAETSARVAALHAAYEALGLTARDHVGIIGSNSPEWMMALQGINRLNGVCVPLYDTLGDAAVEYVVKHAEIKLIVAHASKLSLLTRLAADRGLAPQIAGGVIFWGEVDQNDIQALGATGIKVLSWDKALDLGRAQPVAPRKPTPEDICTIMYTSGTTGNPKGVVLTHRAVLSTIAGLSGFVEQLNKDIGTGDVYLSFLTMAHIFGRVAEEYMLHRGVSIGYWQGDARKLMDDVGALSPTVFAGVPRIFERIYGGVQDSVKKGGLIKRLVFSYAYWRKLWYIKNGAPPENASWLSDVLVFNKIKARLGGRVRIIVSGGAPIPAHVEEFLKVAMCAPAAQGYGLTETCAASFLSNPYSYAQSFTVGPPMPHTELRLEAVPEMGYDPAGTPPRGEVCIRSPGLFNGYYKEETMTKEALDVEGFFHTGDIGELTPDGALRLIDRKKNLFKLSHGEYIAVERVENVYKACEAVEQIWVYGNSFESSLVAVVVPRESAVRGAAAAAGIEGAAQYPLKELLKNPAVKADVLAKLRATGKAGKLKGFEDIKDIVLEEEQFSVENDLMTPSFKLKRPQLLKHYQKQIDDMYARLRKAGGA